MKIHSEIRRGGRVIFPNFSGDEIYMQRIHQNDNYRDVPSRWRDTVSMMLENIITELPIYLMVDQKRLEPGQLHRRGGAHIDGNWISADHQHDGPLRHRISAGGRHDRHNIKACINPSPDLILIASNREACQAFVGDFEGEPTPDGDCSHFDLFHANVVPMLPNVVYILNGMTIHESIPVKYHCERTVVRLNIPGYMK